MQTLMNQRLDGILRPVERVALESMGASKHVEEGEAVDFVAPASNTLNKLAAAARIWVRAA